MDAFGSTFACAMSVNNMAARPALLALDGWTLRVAEPVWELVMDASYVATRHGPTVIVFERQALPPYSLRLVFVSASPCDRFVAIASGTFQVRFVDDSDADVLLLDGAPDMEIEGLALQETGRDIIVAESVHGWDPLDAMMGLSAFAPAAVPVEPSSRVGMAQVLGAFVKACGALSGGALDMGAFRNESRTLSQAWVGRFARKNDVEPELAAAWDRLDSDMRAVAGSHSLVAVTASAQALLLHLGGAAFVPPQQTQLQVKTRMRESLRTFAGRVTAVMRYDYNGVRCGDVVALLAPDQDGWSHVLTDARVEATVPSSYLQLLPGDLVIDPTTMRASRASAAPTSAAVRKGQGADCVVLACVEAVRCAAMQKAPGPALDDCMAVVLNEVLRLEHTDSAKLQLVVDCVTALQDGNRNAERFSVPSIAEALKGVSRDCAALAGAEPHGLRERLAEMDLLAAEAALLAKPCPYAMVLHALRETLKGLLQWARTPLHERTEPSLRFCMALESQFTALLVPITTPSDVRALVVAYDRLIAEVALAHKRPHGVAPRAAHLYCALSDAVRASETKQATHAVRTERIAKHRAARRSSANARTPARPVSAPPAARSRAPELYPVRPFDPHKFTRAATAISEGFIAPTGPISADMYCVDAPWAQTSVPALELAEFGVSADNTDYLVHGIVLGAGPLSDRSRLVLRRRGDVLAKSKAVDPPHPRFMFEFQLALRNNVPLVLDLHLLKAIGLLRGALQPPIALEFTNWSAVDATRMRYASLDLSLHVTPARVLPFAGLCVASHKLRIVTPRLHYFPGETVTGVVVLSVRGNPVNVAELAIAALGTHDTTSWYTYSCGSSTCIAVVHDSNLLFSETRTLTISDKVHVLAPGQYVFSFELKLPYNLPASSVCSKDNTGSLFSYRITATLKEPSKRTIVTNRFLTITYSPLPVAGQDEPIISALKFKVSKEVPVLVSLQVLTAEPIDGFVPYRIMIGNRTKRKTITSVSVSFEARISATAEGCHTSENIRSPAVNIDVSVAPRTTHEADYTITVPKEFAAFYTYDTEGATALSAASVTVALVLHVGYGVAKVTLRRKLQLAPRLGPLRGVAPPLLPEHRDEAEFHVSSAPPDQLPWYFFWA